SWILYDGVHTLVIIRITKPVLVMCAEAQPMPGRGVESQPSFAPIIPCVGVAEKCRRRSRDNVILLDLADVILLEPRFSEQDRERDFCKSQSGVLHYLAFVQIRMDRGRIQNETCRGRGVNWLWIQSDVSSTMLALPFGLHAQRHAQALDRLQQRCQAEVMRLPFEHDHIAGPKLS